MWSCWTDKLLDAACIAIAWFLGQVITLHGFCWRGTWTQLSIWTGQVSCEGSAHNYSIIMPLKMFGHTFKSITYIHS